MPEYNDRWTAAWTAGVSPGVMWDAQRTEVAFQNALDKGMFKPLVDTALANGQRAARALVPGCGRGYAVASLAAAGFATVGLDLVDKALDEARAYLDSTKDNSSPEALERVRLQAGDFFALKPADVDGEQDLIYDCTFLCALHPSMRLAWAQRMNALLRPGGQLAIMVFPIVPHSPQKLADDPNEGPPFPLSSSLVQELLGGAGFTCVHGEDVPDEQLTRAARGRERFEVWEKSNAHSTAGGDDSGEQLQQAS